jgi:general secretion pathway protein D
MPSSEVTRTNLNQSSSPVAGTKQLEPLVTLGTGKVLNHKPLSSLAVQDAEDSVTLNFEASSLREFLKVVFEEILQENYMIDAQVKGQVTLNTSRPVGRDAVLGILESVLHLNGAAMVLDQGLYKILPLQSASGGLGVSSVGQAQASASPGYGIQIVPLAHVAAREIEKIIKPLMPKGIAIQIDEHRNLLILSGPRYAIINLLETISIFDVDWLTGMSFGLYPLRYADADSLVDELRMVLHGDAQSPYSGAVQLMPIDRLNSVLVMATRAAALDGISKLIKQFDRGSDAGAGRKLFVYHLTHGKAETIAGLLQQLFDQDGGTNNSGDASSSGSMLAGGAGVEESEQPVTIISDQENNAILVMASLSRYRAVEQVIENLDVASRQVLIEATIAEVALSNNLNYGVRWFYDEIYSNRRAEVSLGAPLPGGAGGDGLTIALFNSSNQVRLFFDLLESESTVNFLSTPQLLVTDNHTATIRVGDQIPVTVRSVQSTNDADAPLVTEVQYRDTGTSLSISPRINSGGQVTMDISQEISLPGTQPAVGGGGNVAIAQRTIETTVVVQSGQTVVLGGLIRESKNDSKSGVTGLMRIPLVGGLFKTTGEDFSRTELIITVRPVVVENPLAAARVTEDLGKRMQEASNYARSVMEK